MFISVSRFWSLGEICIICIMLVERHVIKLSNRNERLQEITFVDKTLINVSFLDIFTETVAVVEVVRLCLHSVDPTRVVSTNVIYSVCRSRRAPAFF